MWEKEVLEKVEEGRKEGRELILRCEVAYREVMYILEERKIKER